MLNCTPYPYPPELMTDDERRAYHASLRASVATHKAHVEEKRETLLRNVGALDETPLDRIREQHYAAWGDSPSE